MKKLVYAFLMLVLPFFSFAQKQADIWYFGNNAGLDFNSGSPVALSNGQLVTNEGCASIADKNTGNLLFYTDGTSVWDQTNSIMPANQSTSLLGNSSSTQSAIIVPMPGSSTKYYIFTTAAQVGSYLYAQTYSGLAYSIVDMTLNGGLGDMSVVNQYLLSSTTEKVTAVKHCNGHDIWVVTHQWATDAFYAYLLTNSGISAPVITHSGIIHQDIGSGDSAEAIGYMKFSSDGKKLALACYEQLNTLQTFDFDNNSGVISAPTLTDTNFPNLSGIDGPYGVSFSPDGSKLYVSDFNTFTASYVFQYDMLAGNQANILASRIIIDSSFSNTFGAIQIGPDQKMYVAKGPFSDSLDVINNPNAAGLSCNCILDGVYLGGFGQSVWGLPDIVESFLIPPVQATMTYQPGCAGSGTVTFKDTTLNGKITFLWNFGDAASGTGDTSSLQNSSHAYSNTGSYTVTLYMSNACHKDTFTQSITITTGAFNVSAGPDLTLCNGASSQINLTGVPNGSTIAWSPTNGLSCTNCPNPTASPSTTTQYTVTVTNSSGCSVSDKLNITITSKVVALVTPHTSTICGSGSVQLLASGGDVYQWSPSAYLSDSSIANPVASPTVTTTYSVTVSVAGGNCGISTDSAVITVSSAPTVQASNDTIICAGDTAFLRSTGTGITAYSWNPPTGLNCTTCPNPHASPLVNTTYTITVNSATACPVTDMVSVTVSGALNLSVIPDTAICSGTSIQLFAAGGNNYHWSPGEGLSDSTVADPIANPSVSTTYSVTVDGGICPSKTAYDTIIVNSLPTVNAGSDVSIISGNSVQLNASGTGTQFLWEPTNNISNTGIADPMVNPVITTTYTVEVTNQFGCTASDDVVVNVQAPAFIMFPNAFSPNGDGTNDVLLPEYFEIATMDLKIFNRWGQLIFESANLNDGWDGKFNGQDEPVGAYAYAVIAVTTYGQTIRVKGNVTLIR